MKKIQSNNELTEYSAESVVGYLLLNSREYDKAVECYESCGESLLVKDRYRLALAYSLTKKFKEAKICYNEFILQTTNKNLYHKALYNKALILVRYLEEDYEIALECIDQVLKYKPYDIDAWVVKGNILKKQGYEIKANKCYKRSLFLRENSDSNILEKIFYSLFVFLTLENPELFDPVYPLFKDYNFFDWESIDD